jgi:enhancing lycopene biosynthesis protein 2
MKHVAVVLSGCGYEDGSEITESVSTLIALSEAGANYRIFAPNHDYVPINHMTSEADSKQIRNCMVESARVARGHIHDIRTLSESDFDAVVFPGGFGAAIHLSNWGKKGAQCDVSNEVERVIKAFHKASKPIGAICIAPALVAKVLGAEKVSLTIGNNREVADEIKKTGAQHVDCPVDDFITDRLHKVISTPAYMYDTTPHLVFKGISGLIKELVEMA